MIHAGPNIKKLSEKEWREDQIDFICNFMENLIYGNI